MIPDFISRSLILALGYAYPAFQCFKTIEKNRVDIKELRFWCQYWIIVAALTVLEKFSDIFVSWFPMYREMKLALFIYLWHPNLKGTGYVYETLLRPYVSRHEADIDRLIFEFKERAWNLGIYCWHNCTELSSQKILQLFQFMISQSANITLAKSSQIAGIGQSNVAPPPPTPPSTPSGIFKRINSDKRRPPIPIPGPTATPHLGRKLKSESVRVRLRNETQFIHSDHFLTPDFNSNSETDMKEKSEIEPHLDARVKLRRIKSN